MAIPAHSLDDVYKTLESSLTPDPDHKIAIRFKAVGRAPILRQQIYKISSSQPFGAVNAFLRKQLGTKKSDPLYIYVNMSFLPAADELLLNLYKCFKTDETLVLFYSPSAAFG